MQTFRKKFFKKIRTYFFCIDYQPLIKNFQKKCVGVLRMSNKSCTFAV